MYAYVENSPTNAIDKSGLADEFTEESALQVLATERNKWRANGWHFAANLLSYFIGKRGPSPYYGSGADNDAVKYDTYYRAAMKHELGRSAYFLYRSKCFQDPPQKTADEHLKKGANWLPHDHYFEVNYATSVPWGNLFYALGNAHFGVDGRLSVDCCNGDWWFSGDVYQKDSYEFPESWIRNRFIAYRAAAFLQSRFQYQKFSVRQKWYDRFEGKRIV